MNLMGNYCKTSFLQNKGKAPISQTFFGTRLIPISPIFRPAFLLWSRKCGPRPKTSDYQRDLYEIAHWGLRIPFVLALCFTPRYVRFLKTAMRVFLFLRRRLEITMIFILFGPIPVLVFSRSESESCLLLLLLLLFLLLFLAGGGITPGGALSSFLPAVYVLLCVCVCHRRTQVSF